MPLFSHRRAHLSVTFFVLLYYYMTQIRHFRYFLVQFRFSPENRDQINQYAYLPFGNGPRNCIGQRLALLELKMTVIGLIQKFRIIRSPKLQVYFFVLSLAVIISHRVLPTVVKDSVLA